MDVRELASPSHEFRQGVMKGGDEIKIDWHCQRKVFFEKTSMTMEKPRFLDVFLLHMMIFHGDLLVYCRVAQILI